MSLGFWKQASSALAGLNADAVLQESETPFAVALVGSPDEVSTMEDWLVPPSLNTAQQAQARRRIYSITVPLSIGDRGLLQQATIRIAAPSALPPVSQELHAITRDYFPFHPDDAAHIAARIVASQPDLQLALSRNFPALRDAVVTRIIQKTAKENAAFAIVSALPNVIPSPIELPWAVGEFASDTIVITANQMRMALAIAAACDTPVGFGEQRGQVASILGSAFGLRAIARELAGKIPAGGGMAAKGLIAFAGTYTLGLGLARWNRSGRRPSRGEKRLAYQRALESGRELINDLVRRALPS
jgi:hypothetical protein